MKRFRAFVVFRFPVWMLADAQTNPGGSNAHVQWFSHLKIMIQPHGWICPMNIICNMKQI